MGKGSKSFGQGVAEAARSFEPSVEDESGEEEGHYNEDVIGDVSFDGLMTTTQDDIMHHVHDHSHEDDHVCDGNCGEDCPHAHNHEEEKNTDTANLGAGLDGLAAARGGRGGKKSSDDTDSGSGGRGGGRWKKQAEEEPVAEEPAPEPTPEPAPEEPVAEEPAPEPTPEPAPEEPVAEEPAPEPTPQPSAEFGWLDANTYLSGGDTPNGFNLELSFKGTQWTTSQKEMAAAQAELLSDYIIGDLADNGSIDDIRIDMHTWDLDGSGGVWGRGGHTSEGSDGIADTGVVYLDESDLATAESWGMLDELMMHEMLHAIGWGTNWDGLTSGNTFIGETAESVYGSAVPIDGNGHLAESVGNEMGTTYISNNAEDFSELTLAVLEDMGFETIYEPPVEEEDPMFDEMLLG